MLHDLLDLNFVLGIGHIPLHGFVHASGQFNPITTRDLLIISADRIFFSFYPCTLLSIMNRSR